METERLKQLIDTRSWSGVRAVLRDVPPPELAELLFEVEKPNRILLFRSLHRDQSAEVFSHLDPGLQDALLKDLTDGEARHLLSELDPDDRTALLEEMPAIATKKMLALLSAEDLREARQLLGYPEETVGRLMTPDYVRVFPEMTAYEALEDIRMIGHDSETINMIYVTNKNGKLLDDFKLRKLILAKQDVPISSLMDDTFVSLSAFDDREMAVSMMQRYDLVALPVTDSNGILLGIVTFDDVMDVAEEEVTEDIHKSASVEPLKMSYHSASVRSLYMKRVSWLIMLVLLNLVSAGVIAAYEESLAEMVVLLFFIPILIASGGNTGAQSSTLIIRALVTGDISLDQWGRTFVKEIAVGALLALTLGVIGGTLGFIRGGFRFDIMLAIALSMTTIVIMGNAVGMVLPFVLARLNLDPATASGPLITTIADAGGLLIYFSISTAIIAG